MTFFKSEKGTATIEFVIMLPLIFFFFALVGVASHLFALSSDVQQTSFEVARKSVQYATPGRPVAEVCVQVMTRFDRQQVSELSAFLVPHQIAQMSCKERGRDFLEFALDYTLKDSFVTRLGSRIGINVGRISRSAVIGL
jgi:hypothetical protein